jgi:hypothetical protein
MLGVSHSPNKPKASSILSGVLAIFMSFSDNIQAVAGVDGRYGRVEALKPS